MTEIKYLVKLKVIKMSVIIENIEEKRTRGDDIHTLSALISVCKLIIADKSGNNVIDPNISCKINYCKKNGKML